MTSRPLREVICTLYDPFADRSSRSSISETRRRSPSGTDGWSCRRGTSFFGLRRVNLTGDDVDLVPQLARGSGRPRRRGWTTPCSAGRRRPGRHSISSWFRRAWSEERRVVVSGDVGERLLLSLAYHLGWVASDDGVEEGRPSSPRPPPRRPRLRPTVTPASTIALVAIQAQSLTVIGS